LPDAPASRRGVRLAAGHHRYLRPGSHSENGHLRQRRFLSNGQCDLGTFSNVGSADWTIDKGSVIAMDQASDAAVFNGKTVKFTATGQYNMPSAGVRYSSYFKPQTSTYDEVKP